MSFVVRFFLKITVVYFIAYAASFYAIDTVWDDDDVGKAIYPASVAETAVDDSVDDSEELMLTVMQPDQLDSLYRVLDDGRVLDFHDDVLVGRFTLSRKLSHEEHEHVAHGGTLTDSDGNEVAAGFTIAIDEGLYFIDPDVKLTPGLYTYRLYLNVHGRWIEDRIYFFM